VSDSNLEAAVNNLISTLRSEWDTRLYVCEVTAQVCDGLVSLEGYIDRSHDTRLLSAVRRLSGVRSIRDGLVRLPDKALGSKTVGLVRVAVANLGSSPGKDKERDVVTQAHLAEQVEVLREVNGYYLVRLVGDGYLGWIKGESLLCLDQAGLAAYLDREQVLVTAEFAPIWRASAGTGEPGEVTPATDGGGGAMLVTAVMGTMLPLRSSLPPAATLPPGLTGLNCFAVILPGGETGLIESSYGRRLPQAQAVFAEKRPAEEVIALAKSCLGRPYLWGGTTPHGFDCSGFVQLVFGLCGYPLPRDADMQFAAGVAAGKRSELRPGDLVFWTTYQPGPSHVGIYIGEGRYIHCSPSEGVAVNSLDPRATDYNAKLDMSYIGARRILGHGP
jgi:cell wall-associated NlpC family hydrolase